MADQRGAELPEGATDRPSPDVLVFPGLRVPQTVYVESFGWRCEHCGWLGTGLLSVDSAMREAHRHIKSDHPEMETANVEMTTR